MTNTITPRRVVFVVGTPWASGYYRMTQAQELMSDLGFTADSVMYTSLDAMSLTTIRTALNKEGKLVGVLTDLKQYDTIVFQIVWHHLLLNAMRLLKGLGKRIVMELDDDYFALPVDNPSWWSFHPKAELVVRDSEKKIKLHKEKVNFALDNLTEACRTADMLQVSTPELAEVYSKVNSNVVVLENCIDNELYDDVSKVKGRTPVIGWFGTRTHKEDLGIVRGCFPEDIPFRLLIAGYPEAKERVFKNASYVTRIRPYPLKDLPKIVSYCDFGIVPLRACRFNDGKSDLKGVEFGAGGIPVIASDVAPYCRWIRHGVNGFLCKKNKVKYWIRNIRLLLENEELRKSMGREAKKDAIERDIRNNINKWIKVYFK